jgi:ACR3 family arsenite efflux pump ArsB
MNIRNIIGETGDPCGIPSFILIIVLILPSKANRIVRSLIKLMNHLISSVGSFIYMQILANGAARTVGYAFLMSRASTLVIESLFLVR